MEQTFWEKWKVFILGGLAAIAVVLQEFVGQQEVDLKVLLYAVVMTVLAYLASQWRGQGLSITGIVGTLSAVFITVNQTGQFSWTQFFLQAIIAIIAAAAPDPKSKGYEHTDAIKQAKKEGEAIQPASLTTKPK